MSRRTSTPSAAQIRWMNAAAVYDAMRDGGSSTATDLMTLTGLSRPTVHTTCDWLIAQGLVVEVPSDPAQDAQPGRPARRYRTDPQAGFVVSLDVRESRVTAAVADLTGRVCGELSHEVGTDTTLRSQVTTHGPAIAHEVIALAGIAPEAVWQVCVSIPAPVQSHDYDAATAAQYRAGSRDVITELEHTLPWPVVAENDANLAMIGEHWQGAARGLRNAVLLDVCENGFGAGLIVNGRLVRGSKGVAGEMTAVSLLADMGPPGGVTRKAAQLGAEAVRLGAEAAGGATAGPGRLVEMAAGRPEAVTADMVFAAYDAGDPVASRIVDRLGSIVARPVAMVATFLDPELVVICGLPAATSARLMPAIGEHTRDLCERQLGTPAPRLSPAALGGRATVLGGVRRALDEVEGRLFGASHSDRWSTPAAPSARTADAR
ncbi:ROK family transcriptional regulator [Streptomyces sp. NBC_01198]|uniref:ROK family transcriptional regulator n=1 Tax=Streptomyces sp. NBC_01198 TaxID=2903769 RepID=UPI002E135547|nr:ROK family transcriptional regulator [Streptomyces sp. NBC_01198]